MTRPIVYRSLISPITIEWNTQNTFNVFNDGKEVDCFYSYSAHPTMPGAVRIAREWIINNVWS